MSRRLDSKMECLFGFFGVLIGGFFIYLASFFTPGYDPLLNTVSSLGEGPGKTLFSIGFVISGSLCIPFYIYLERELVNIKENIRRLATGVSIFTSVCIALVGIIPDDKYLDIFYLFHSFVAYVSFIGSCIYIGLYSLLMYQSNKSKTYTGPKFKKFLAYLGFIINVFLIILLITLKPLIEWILTTLIILWILITSFYLILYKFFNIPGMYYKRSKYPEALDKFEAALEVLKNLDLSDEPITHTLEENIEFLKSKVEQKKE
jgi:glucan phosphoethanolaminetransferase (alkaline phosphatase superfamily)